MPKPRPSSPLPASEGRPLSPLGQRRKFMSNSGSASPAGVRPPPCSSSSSSESSSFNSATSSSFKNMPKNWRAEIGVVRCALCRKKLVNLQHGSHECGGWGSAALMQIEGDLTLPSPRS